MDGFWDQREGFMPEPTQSVDDLRGVPKRLNIVCTQLPIKPHAQRKIVQAWCDALPSLEGIEYLWFRSRVTQAMFDAACRVPGLKGLYVKWSGIKHVDAIHEAKSLRKFHLGSSTGLESIEPLRTKTKLDWLDLEGIKRITCLEPLAPLQSLVGLSVEGSMWTTQCVDTLAPIGKLTDLRYLAITNLRAKDKTLKPLFSLRKLERFSAAMWWDEAEQAELHRLNPKLTPA